MIPISKEQYQESSGATIDDATWLRVRALLRRAQRELTLMLGDLHQFDEETVIDALVDAVAQSGQVDNPGRLRSESDGDYSYTRYDLPGGAGRTRFWWPYDLCALFGDPDTEFCRMGAIKPGKIRMVPLRSSSGYLGWPP